MIRSVSRVTVACANASSVFQVFSFLVVCSGMISNSFGFVAFYASVKASSVCIHLSCLVFIYTVYNLMYSSTSNLCSLLCKIRIIFLVVTCWKKSEVCGVSKVIAYFNDLPLKSIDSNYTERSLSKEANRSSPSLEIPRILWNPEFSLPHSQKPTPVPNLSQLIPVHATTILLEDPF